MSCPESDNRNAPAPLHASSAQRERGRHDDHERAIEDQGQRGELGDARPQREDFFREDQGSQDEGTFSSQTQSAPSDCYSTSPLGHSSFQTPAHVSVLVCVVVPDPVLRSFQPLLISPLWNQVEVVVGAVHHVDAPGVA